MVPEVQKRGKVCKQNWSTAQAVDSTSLKFYYVSTCTFTPPPGRSRYTWYAWSYWY